MTIEQLRDEVAVGVNCIETSTDRIRRALRELERDHKLDCNYARAAHEMIDIMTQLDSILEDVDQQLRERAQ